MKLKLGLNVRHMKIKVALAIVTLLIALFPHGMSDVTYRVKHWIYPGEALADCERSMVDAYTIGACDAFAYARMVANGKDDEKVWTEFSLECCKDEGLTPERIEEVRGYMQAVGQLEKKPPTKEF